MERAAERLGMPLDAFLEAANREPFELINGERIPKLPNVSGHSDLIRILFVALYLWSVENAAGEVFSETTFVLPDADERDWIKGSRIPDVMVLNREKVAAWKRETPDHALRPYPIVPEVVIEVVSPNDGYSEIGDKVQLYLHDGVKLVLVVDPQQRNVAVHTPDMENPVILRGDAVFEDEDILPGFKISLADLFKSL